MKLKIIICLTVILLAFSSDKAQTAAVAGEKPSAAEAELRRQSFEKVWNTINEKHYDPTFGGVDWKKVRQIYEPKASAAKDRSEFHRVLLQMLGELKLSHFGIFPLPAADSADSAALYGGTIGVEVKMIDGKPLIYRVLAGSTAEKAHLKTGFVIEKIDGKTVVELLAPLEKSLAERSNESLKEVYRERVLESLLGGKVGLTEEIEVTNAANQPEKFTVQIVAAPTEMSQAVGNFPPQPVVFEAKRLDGNVGYIRFNIWVIPQMAKIRQAVKDFADAKGIIFDVRGNPGGIGGMAPGIVGLLTTEQISLGSMNGRGSVQKFIVYPQANPFTGKVCVLTDHGSASTSEIFAVGLQENNRARIVGETTAGAVLPSVFDTLPTGAIFQYAIADYQSPKNVLIEGRGVKPDLDIPETRRALLDGRDLPLEAALKSILN